jgi:hypothetical protein
MQHSEEMLYTKDDSRLWALLEEAKKTPRGKRRKRRTAF